MTYAVSSGTLNSTIPYHTIPWNCCWKPDAGSGYWKSRRADGGQSDSRNDQVVRSRRPQSHEVCRFKLTLEIRTTPSEAFYLQMVLCMPALLHSSWMYSRSGPSICSRCSWTRQHILTPVYVHSLLTLPQPLSLLLLLLAFVMPRPRRAEALSYAFVWRLSVAYIGPNSRTERPRKTKVEVAHVTHDSDTTFKVKRSKVNLFWCLK